MLSDEVSPEIRRLIYLVLKSMIEKTKTDLRVPVAFEQVYVEVCKMDTKTNNKHDHSNLEIRHHVRDILLKNGYIFVNPDDAEDVFITKKAIDQYETLGDE
jgi:hypothetical protein